LFPRAAGEDIDRPVRELRIREAVYVVQGAERVGPTKSASGCRTIDGTTCAWRAACVAVAGPAPARCGDCGSAGPCVPAPHG